MSTAEFDTYTPRPRYECTRGGVYHIGIKTDKEGNTSETPPVWLSDPIRLIGRGTDGTDGTGSHYRIIEWKDRLTGAAKQAPAYEAAGTAQEWNAEIGQYLTGNSRLCLAVGTALVAPLIGLLGMEARAASTCSAIRGTANPPPPVLP